MLLSTIPITSLGISYSLFQRFSYTLFFIVDIWRTWNNSFFLSFFYFSSWILSKSLNKFSIFSN
jgi:hypothetical protein